MQVSTQPPLRELVGVEQARARRIQAETAYQQCLESFERVEKEANQIEQRLEKLLKEGRRAEKSRDRSLKWSQSRLLKYLRIGSLVGLGCSLLGALGNKAAALPYLMGFGSAAGVLTLTDRHFTEQAQSKNLIIEKGNLEIRHVEQEVQTWQSRFRRSQQESDSAKEQLLQMQEQEKVALRQAEFFEKTLNPTAGVEFREFEDEIQVGDFRVARKD